MMPIFVSWRSVSMLGWSGFLIGLLVVPQVRAEFDLGSALNEQQLSQTGEYLSGFSVMNRLKGAGKGESKGWRFELAAHGNLAKLKPLRDSLGSPNNENITGSIIGVPKAVLRVGYENLTLGVGFIPAVKIEGASIEVIGGEMTFHIGDWLDWPLKVDVRGFVSTMTLGYSTTVGNTYPLRIDVSMAFSSLGANMGFSYPLGGKSLAIEPYGSAGFVALKSNYGDAAVIAGLIEDTDVKSTYSKTTIHLTFGLSIIHFNRLSWALEYERLGKIDHYNFGFNFRFK